MSTDEFFTWTGDHNMDVWAADVYGTEERKPESLPAVLADKARSRLRKPCCSAMRRVAWNRTSSRAAAASSPSRFMGKAESLNLGTSAAVMLMSLSMSGHVERM